MAEQEKEGLFREKALKKITSPDQLSDFLRVTNPSIWIILSAALLLLVGLFIWAASATIETTVSAQVTFHDDIGTVETTGSYTLKAGETIRVGNKTFAIDMVSADETGRVRAYVFAEMPDGEYNATVVITSDHPLDFLYDRR